MRTVAHALNVWLIRQGLATTDPYLRAEAPPVTHSYQTPEHIAARMHGTSVARILRADLPRHRSHKAHLSHP